MHVSSVCFHEIYTRTTCILWSEYFYEFLLLLLLVYLLWLLFDEIVPFQIQAQNMYIDGKF